MYVYKVKIKVKISLYTIKELQICQVMFTTGVLLAYLNVA